MRRLIPLLIVVAFVACESPTSEETEVSGIRYELITVTAEDPDCTTDRCTNVNLKYPYFSGDSLLAARANLFTNRSIAEAMGMGDAENPALNDLEKDAEFFISQFKQLKQDFPETTQSWEFTTSMTHFFENDTLISFGTDVFAYTGGAHSNSYKIFYNLDRNSGNLIRQEEIMDAFPDLMLKAEGGFKRATEMNDKLSFSEAGFSFVEDKFLLPSNIAFTGKGLELHYNKYEVAAYAYGDINFVIPYSELVD